MKNKTIIIASTTIVALAGIIAYRQLVPPFFQINQYIPSTHSGRYQFGKAENNFGNSSGTIGGRSGWDLDVKMQKDGTTKFDLLKRGKFVKTLAIK